MVKRTEVGSAESAEPTAVGDGEDVQPWYDLQGRQIVALNDGKLEPILIRTLELEDWQEQMLTQLKIMNQQCQNIVIQYILGKRLKEI